MKKAALFFVLIGVMASCGVTKVERQAQRTLNGNWSLVDVTYPGSSGFVDVTLFQDAATQCFRHSDWHFVSNNNEGYYQLYKSDCAPGKRGFHWNLYQGSDGQYYFTLKPDQEGVKARAIKNGYNLKVVRLDETQMILRETVSYNGESFVIQLKFNKQ